MTMRLKDLEFDARLPHDKENTYTVRTTQAFNVYTNSLFEFDKDAAYHMKVSGEAWQPSANGLVIPTEATGATMVAVDRLIWLAKNGSPDHIVKPHVAVRFLGTTKDDPDVEMYIPVSSIISFTSYRYAYFTGYQDVQ